MAGIKSALFAMLVNLVGACCNAQPSARYSIENLGFLKGEWVGKAWVSLGPDNIKALEHRESVELKLNNNILQIHGTGIENNKVVFEALGIVSFNKDTGTYAFKAYRENGMVTDAYFILRGEKEYEWGFELGGGARSRYSGRINHKGFWNEVGEFSPDGTQWYKSFEMTLDKRK
jgi:hypothetical protein